MFENLDWRDLYYRPASCNKPVRRVSGHCLPRHEPPLVGEDRTDTCCWRLCCPSYGQRGCGSCCCCCEAGVVVDASICISSADSRQAFPELLGRGFHRSRLADASRLSARHQHRAEVGNLVIGFPNAVTKGPPPPSPPVEAWRSPERICQRPANE